MHNHTYEKEVVKRKYFDQMKDKDGFCDSSIDSFARAILLWEDFTNNEDFSSLKKDDIKEFKKWLKNKKKKNGKGTVSLSYCYDVLRYLKGFFEWLSSQPMYKSKIKADYIGYFNLSKKEVEQATQRQRKKIPTVEEVKKTIESIEVKNEVDQRDKALLSLTFLTGMRISALKSLPMQSFDEKDLVINQSPKFGVATKGGKRISTRLITLSYEEPLQYFLDWYGYLKKQKKFKPTDPIFPATKKEINKDGVGFYSTGKVDSVFWKSSGSARKIFEKRLKQAGVPYYNPHSFRHLLVKEFSKLRLSEEEKKAFSQNLGHAKMITTFSSYGYGEIEEERQVEILKNIEIGDENKKDMISLVKNMSEEEKQKFVLELIK